MKLSDISNGETFIFNKSKWIRVKKIPRNEAIDCLEINSQRHRPFKPNTEIIPCQRRIEL